MGHEGQGQQHGTSIREGKLYACVVTDVKGDSKRDVKKGTSKIVWIAELVATYIGGNLMY